MKDKKENKRKKHKFLNILLYLFFVVFIFFVFYRMHMSKSLSARLDAARAAGYPVTFDELNQWYLMPLDEENSANIILNAIQYYISPVNTKLVKLIDKEEYQSRTESMNEETKDIVSQYLNSNQKCLDLLHQTIGLENGRYPADFRLGQGVQLPPLSEIRNFLALLQLEAISAAENKNTDAAIQSIKSMFGVTNSLNKEPTIVSQFSKYAFQIKIVLTLENVINKVTLSDEQLVELINELEKAGQVNGTVNAILGERIMDTEMIMHPKSSDFDPARFSLFSFPPILSLYTTIGLNNSDAILLYEITDNAIEASNLPPHKRMEAADALDSEIKSIPAKNVLLGIIIPSFGRIIKSDLRVIAEFRAAQVSLAIERFRLANNKLPESLDEIIPDYLDSVPLDPYDGKEIRYKKLEMGFVVYSIGKDQVDDSGKEDPKDKSDSTYDITFIIEK